MNCTPWSREVNKCMIFAVKFHNYEITFSIALPVKLFLFESTHPTIILHMKRPSGIAISQWNVFLSQVINYLAGKRKNTHHHKLVVFVLQNHFQRSGGVLSKVAGPWYSILAKCIIKTYLPQPHWPFWKAPKCEEGWHTWSHPRGSTIHIQAAQH